MAHERLKQKRRVERTPSSFGMELHRKKRLRDVNNALVRACGKRASRLNEDVGASTALSHAINNKFKFSEDAESARSFALTKRAFQPSGSDWSSTA